MPIDPRRQPITAEGRQVDRLASLERRLAAQERASLNAVFQRRVSDEELAQVQTTSVSYVDLGGPSVTVNVPDGAFLAVYVELDFLNWVSAPDASVGLLIDDSPGGIPNTLFNPAGTEATPTWETRRLGSRIIIRATAGSRTMSFRYKALAASANPVTFRNRRLWAEAI